jgi:exodeoxyribonuclease V alpha subunit
MTALNPLGTARARFLAGHGDGGERESATAHGAGEDDFAPMYLGWEIARCAAGLPADDMRAIAALAAACVMAVRGGSTRLPLDEAHLASVMAHLGAVDAVATVSSIVRRARAADPADPVSAVIGRGGDRKPLILDGDWLYPERMRTLEDRFCTRVRDRLARAAVVRDPRSLGRALNAVALGPPPLTDEQKRAVREALGARIALISGGPGTGKTTIVVALLRALAWTGEPMAAIAIAAPTGKAAQRLREAIATGLASTSHGLDTAALHAIAPTPQTLHRLLGWSPSTGRFGRHENDPLPHRVVVVDEASMVDLAMMERLIRALAVDACLVLLGDSDQLPSVEAGAVFRDLCAALRPVRLSKNLRVEKDAAARQIIGAAHAVNGGLLDARFSESIALRRSVAELTFEGVEHLVASWAEAGEDLLDRWWRLRVASLDDFARRISRSYRWQSGAFDDQECANLRALFDHHARARLLCVTRAGTLPTSAEAINHKLLARFRGLGAVGAVGSGVRRSYQSGLAQGAPVVVERNDYERQLFNGDQGLIVRVGAGQPGDTELMVVFPQGDAFRAFPLDALAHLAPSFAMTVHKAQGSEFDHVALVLPDADLPLLTRELVYTAMTRARRSVLVMGGQELLARAVSRTVERHSGIAERLANSRT